MAFQVGPWVSNGIANQPAIEHWKQEKSEEGAADDPADDDGGERALDFGSGSFADGHGDEAEAGDERRHEHGAQALQAAFGDGLFGIAAFIAQLIEATDEHHTV